MNKKPNNQAKVSGQKRKSKQVSKNKTKNLNNQQATPINLYDANTKDAYHSPKFDFNDINDSVVLDGMPLLLQAREREANSAILSGALNRMVTLIVGESGTMVKPVPLINGNEVDHELAEKIQIKWREFCVSPLVNNKSYNFRALQALIVRSWKRDGEVFVQLITKESRTNKNKKEFKLRIIEADKLPYQSFSNYFNKIANQPIELDEYGTPIAYNFTLNPYYASEVTRIVAEDILHIANVREANQLRGVSQFAPVLKIISKIDKFLDTVINSAQLRNLYIGSITTTDLGGTLIDGSQGGALVKNHKINQNLQFLELAKGKTLNLHSPQNTDVNLSQFMDTNLRFVASSLGIDFEGLFLRYDGTYSSLKMSQINIEKQTKANIDYFDNCIVRPIYRKFVEFLLMNDPDFKHIKAEQYTSIYNATYNHNGFSSIDPLKEAEANLILLRSGLVSVQGLASKTGISAEEIAQQNSNLKETYDNLGLQDVWGYLFPQEKEIEVPVKTENVDNKDSDDSKLPSEEGQKSNAALKISGKKRKKALNKNTRI